jgi:hypothetical protein
MARSPLRLLAGFAQAKDPVDRERSDAPRVVPKSEEDYWDSSMA